MYGFGYYLQALFHVRRGPVPLRSDPATRSVADHDRLRSCLTGRCTDTKNDVKDVNDPAGCEWVLSMEVVGVPGTSTGWDQTPPRHVTPKAILSEDVE